MQVTFSLVLGPASRQESSCGCRQRPSKAATATRLGWAAGQGQAKLFLKSLFCLDLFLMDTVQVMLVHRLPEGHPSCHCSLGFAALPDLG